jgi:predicted metal-binding membrane protein
LRFGWVSALHCIYCCAGFTAVLLAIGVMDLPALALVTALITVERLALRGDLVVQVVGAVVAGVGLFWTARAAVLG